MIIIIISIISIIISRSSSSIIIIYNIIIIIIIVIVIVIIIIIIAIRKCENHIMSLLPRGSINAHRERSNPSWPTHHPENAGCYHAVSVKVDKKWIKKNDIVSNEPEF